jgi:hypothetical protein
MHRARNASTVTGILRRRTDIVCDTSNGLVVGDSARQWQRRRRQTPSSPSLTPARQSIGSGRIIKCDFSDIDNAYPEAAALLRSTGKWSAESPKVSYHTACATDRQRSCLRPAPNPSVHPCHPFSCS